jgi:hypothetical protein
MAKKKWIQSAIKRPGAFKAKAKKAGMTTRGYAEKVVANPGNYDERTVKQARLALKLMSMRK